jgi:hypothetical protein
MARRIALLILAVTAMVACASPEAGRSRGGGPGADAGNRATVLQLHDGSRPFYGTPLKAPAR